MWHCTTILLTEKRAKINCKGIMTLYIVVVKRVKSIYRYSGFDMLETTGYSHASGRTEVFFIRKIDFYAYSEK